MMLLLTWLREGQNDIDNLKDGWNMLREGHEKLSQRLASGLRWKSFATKLLMVMLHIGMLRKGLWVWWVR